MNNQCVNSDIIFFCTKDLNKSIATSTRVANGNGKKRKIQGKGWKEKTSLEYRNHLVNIL